MEPREGRRAGRRVHGPRRDFVVLRCRPHRRGRSAVAQEGMGTRHVRRTSPSRTHGRERRRLCTGKRSPEPRWLSGRQFSKQPYRCPVDMDNGNSSLFLHDGWLAVVASTFGRVLVDPRPLTRYRQHAKQVTGMGMIVGNRIGPPGTPLEIDTARATAVAAVAGPTQQATRCGRSPRSSVTAAARESRSSGACCRGTTVGTREVREQP